MTLCYDGSLILFYPGVVFMSRSETPYNRVLLKISGESLADETGTGIDSRALDSVARNIIEAAETGCQIAVVIGGGNLIRGAKLAKEGYVHQASADYMGMLGTIINGVALREAVERLGKQARLMSAITITAVAEPFIRHRALRHLEKGRIVILAGGTGNPFCTTDTGAALRATELKCEVILKATKVDGVYDSDPNTNPDAKRFDHLTFNEAISMQLGVMDLTAFSMCTEQNVPIIVFNFREPGSIKAVVSGKAIGTLVDAGAQ